jgi:Holliday junction resolvasome RuvABC ATP-dependent DNA helicase subunit
MKSQKDYLTNIIGQEHLKGRLNFYLESYESTGIFPNIMLQSERGSGKSLLCKEIARNLHEYDIDGKPVMVEDLKTKQMKPKKKTFLEISCSTIKSMSQFVEDLYLNYIHEKAVTCFFDETANLNPQVMTAFLTLLNPNPTNKNSLTIRDYNLEFNFKLHTFLFATTQSQKVWEDLRDRLTILELSAYNLSELAKIMQKTLPDVNFEKDLLEEISTYVRSNPRQATTFAQRDISAYLRGGKEFTWKMWKDFIKITNLLPLGLLEQELNLLKMLKNAGGLTLTNLSCRTNLNRGAIRGNHENWLLKNGLISIEEQCKRHITAKGVQYLKSVGC